MQILQIPINQKGMETTRHGTYAFPLAVYETELDKNVLGFVDWHWHDEFQLVRVTRGTVRFCVDERRFALAAGQGLFIGAGRVHCARPGEPDSAYLCLDFHPRLLAGFAGSVLESEYVSPFIKDPSFEAVPLDGSRPWQTKALDCAARIAELSRTDGFGRELGMTALLLEAWQALLECRTLRNRARSHKGNALARAMIDFIGEHYAEPVTVAQITAAAGMSASEGSRVFRRVTGETPADALRTHRIARAMELLARTDLTLEQVAAQTGFCGASYFIRVFRERTGTTPGRFRSENR